MPHSQPYYITQVRPQIELAKWLQWNQCTLILRPIYKTTLQSNVLQLSSERPPWLEAYKKSERALLEFYDSSEKFQNRLVNNILRLCNFLLQRFLEEFLKDSLNEDIYTICSSYLVSLDGCQTVWSLIQAGAKAGVKKDRALLVWLHEEVIGRSWGGHTKGRNEMIYVNHEEVMLKLMHLSSEPVVFDQAELSLYEELWDNARTLTESEAKPLAKYTARVRYTVIGWFSGCMGKRKLKEHSSISWRTITGRYIGANNRNIPCLQFTVQSAVIHLTL